MKRNVGTRFVEHLRTQQLSVEQWEVERPKIRRDGQSVTAQKLARQDKASRKKRATLSRKSFILMIKFVRYDKDNAFFRFYFEEEKATSKADEEFTVRRASGGERNDI